MSLMTDNPAVGIIARAYVAELAINVFKLTPERQTELHEMLATEVTNINGTDVCTVQERFQAHKNAIENNNLTGLEADYVITMFGVANTAMRIAKLL